MPRPTQHIRFCKSRDGTRIAYATCGHGPPLLRAGHTFSHLELEWDCLAWRHWLDLLCRSHTLVRYDMRGTGLSDRRCGEFTLERYAEDFDAVVQAAGFDRFDVIGITGGADVAVVHAGRNPGQVARLVLYAGHSRGRLARSVTAEQREETELLLKLVEVGWGQDNPLFRQLFTYQFMPDATPGHLRSLSELMRNSTSPSTAARLLRGIFSSDLTEHAGRVQCPALVLHAHHDMRIPFDEGRALAALIPGSRFVPIDSRNNMLLEAEPGWEAFTRAFDGFLAPAPKRRDAGSIEGLTARESCVLEVLAQGLGSDAMAARLGISGKTLRNHLSTIYGKLGVTSRSQAIVHARERGFGRSETAPTEEC